MGIGPGFIDAEGIWQYGEDDTETLMSDLLDIGQQSVSDALVLDRARLAAAESALAMPSHTDFLASTVFASGATIKTQCSHRFRSPTTVELTWLGTFINATGAAQTAKLTFVTSAGTAAQGSAAPVPVRSDKLGVVCAGWSVDDPCESAATLTVVCAASASMDYNGMLEHEGWRPDGDHVVGRVHERCYSDLEHGPISKPPEIPASRRCGNPNSTVRRDRESRRRTASILPLGRT